MGKMDDVSDGYHTFREYGDHRRALTAVLAAAAAGDGDSWRSKAHHPDDSPMFEGGYFIVGIDLPTGTISYHYKLSHWDDFAAVPELEHAPKWDGATPADTVSRCFELARLVAEGTVPVAPSAIVEALEQVEITPEMRSELYREEAKAEQFFGYRQQQGRRDRGEILLREGARIMIEALGAKE